MKTAIEYVASLPAGTALMCKATLGLTLIKCADQSQSHRTNEYFVFDGLTGEIKHIAEHFDQDLSLSELLAQWEIELPTLSELEKLAVQTDRSGGSDTREIHGT